MNIFSISFLQIAYSNENSAHLVCVGAEYASPLPLLFSFLYLSLVHVWSYRMTLQLALKEKTAYHPDLLRWMIGWERTLYILGRERYAGTFLAFQQCEL